MLSPVSYSDETQLFYCVPSRFDNIADTDEDAALGFGFVCRALPGADDAVAERLKALFNREWPADALVSIALWAGPDIGDFVAHFRDLRIGQRDPDLRASAEQRAQFIAEGAERPMIDGMRLRLRNIRVIVTVKVPLAAATPTDKEVADCASLRVDIMQALETVGLAPRALTADGYVHTLSTLFNHGPNASWRRGPVTADHDKPLREQVIDWDNEIRRDKHGVWLGSTRLRTLSVKRYPDGVSFGQAFAYLCEPRTGARGVFENVLITATMFFPDPQNAKAFLNTKRTWATNQAYGPLLKFEPMLGMKKKGFDVLFQALDDGDRPCRMYLGIALLAPGEDAATAMVANAISYWGELGFHLMADDFISLPLFVNNLPLGADRRAV
ncbi:MAG TPA: conjugal transfer protein TraC, partial [Steroidobacteraceae bacterium]|nr:conjugal transfer protein TraC [Steroidobacteraceae bacterium]